MCRFRLILIRVMWQRQRLQAGADLVNDIWGFQYDEKMAGLVKKYDAGMLSDA